VASFLQVTVDGTELSRHGKFCKWGCKKLDTRSLSLRAGSASADSANDTVPVDETVRVPQDLINGNEFKGIELWIDYKSVLALAKALD
jgi:hypothetical protein